MHPQRVLGQALSDHELGHYSARPEYYGMLAFSLAGRGELLQTEVDANSPQIKAYATRPKESALMLTVINKGAGPSNVEVNLGGGIQGRQASVIRLSGPAVDAITGISLGGAEVTSTGTWKPSNAELLPVRKGQPEIHLPTASAAIVQLV